MKNFINKILSIFENMRKDTVLHMMFSIMIYVLTFNLTYIFSHNCILAIFIALLIDIIIGICKEYVIDVWIRKSKAEYNDLVADLIGTIIGLILCIPMYFI